MATLVVIDYESEVVAEDVRLALLRRITNPSYKICQSYYIAAP
jgi:hypothetical protein